MKRFQKLLIGTAGALTLAVVSVVAAAPDGTPGSYYGMGPGMMGGGMGMMHGAMFGGQAGAMSAQYLEQMKTRLAISAQQEGVWQVFATKAAEQAALMQATHIAHIQGSDANTPAPERMSQHIGLMTQHLAGMQGVNQAFAALYVQLTPAQKSIADQQFGFMGPRGVGRGMRY